MRLSRAEKWTSVSPCRARSSGANLRRVKRARTAACSSGREVTAPSESAAAAAAEEEEAEEEEEEAEDGREEEGEEVEGCAGSSPTRVLPGGRG